MGSRPIEYDPLLDYWLRMASASFGCIGIASALACLRPDFFRGLIILLDPFHLFIGVVLTAAAINNQLDPDRHPTFLADISFCYLTAILIITPLAVTYKKTRSSRA